MKPELYFDISSTESGGSLFRTRDREGKSSFSWQYSNYDEQTGDIEVFETRYASFEAFWQDLTRDKKWFYQHPLYVHPEQRDFVRQQLTNVPWHIHPDKKWQESHQRAWKKVLTDPKDYYNPF